MAVNTATAPLGAVLKLLNFSSLTGIPNLNLKSTCPKTRYYHQGRYDLNLLCTVDAIACEDE